MSVVTLVAAVTLLAAFAAAQYLACAQGRWGERCESKCYCPEGPGCWCDDGVTGTGECFCWHGWQPAFGEQRAHTTVQPQTTPQAEAEDTPCSKWHGESSTPLCWLRPGHRFQDLGVAQEPGK